MLTNLLLGLPIMVVCLLLQSLLLAIAGHYYRRHASWFDSPSVWPSLAVINGVMLLLVIGNLAQVAIWALLFQLLGEFDQFRDAVYHSAVNFATLGYGDIVMSQKHRLLGPIQAINGVIMIGISTAALMSVFQNMIKKSQRANDGD